MLFRHSLYWMYYRMSCRLCRVCAQPGFSIQASHMGDGNPVTWAIIVPPRVVCMYVRPEPGPARRHSCLGCGIISTLVHTCPYALDGNWKRGTGFIYIIVFILTLHFCYIFCTWPCKYHKLMLLLIFMKMFSVCCIIHLDRQSIICLKVLFSWPFIFESFPNVSNSVVYLDTLCMIFVIFLRIESQIKLYKYFLSYWYLIETLYCFLCQFNKLSYQTK